MEAPRLQPAYLALTNPPDGSIPPFIKGITKFPRPIVATCIRLLTGHAFTGEYTARFRPSSLFHTIVSAENPYKHHNTSSRLARYTSKHGGNSSCQSQTPSQFQPSSARRKAARPWEVFWQHHRLASDHGGERPRRRMKRRRITDKRRGQRAQSHYTNNTPNHNT